MSVNKIIVFHEKHGDSYYDASNSYALRTAMLDVMKSRDGYYYFEPKELDYDITSDEDLELVQMDDNAVAMLPPVLQSEVKKVKARQASYKKAYFREKFFWENLRLVLDSSDIDALEMTIEITSGDRTRKFNAIVYLMSMRQDNAYEGYEVLSLQIPEFLQD